MKRVVFILTLMGALVQYMFGQISEGGTPMSFSMNFGSCLKSVGR